MTTAVDDARLVDKDRPPQDLAAEQSVLGAILSPGSTAVAEVRQVLTAASFYLPKHGTVYEAALCLDDENKPTDIITVAAELERRGELARVGGAPYLHTLYASVPTATNAGTYAAIVAEKAAERIRHEAAERFRHDTNNGVPLDVALARFNGRIADAQLGRPNRPAPGASWRPVDLGPILRGERCRTEPTIGLARSDSVRLLYPGKEHSVIGEMEAGKSWFCLGSCAAELLDGNPVVYIHFEEADEADSVDRLRLLGVPDDALLELFRFVGPEEPVSPAWLERLLDPVPVLVVLDGVNEAISLHDWDGDKSHGAALFRRHLVKPFTRVGAAVLSADHVVKDREKRGRYAMGNVHKGNGLSGALILLENAEPFGRSQRGRSHVFVTKDRPGSLRRHGHAGKAPGKTFMGELIVDDTRAEHDWLDLTFWAPGRDDKAPEPLDSDEDAQLDAEVLAAVRQLAANGDAEINVGKVRALVKAGNQKVGDSLTRLVVGGHLIETKGARNARLFQPK